MIVKKQRAVYLVPARKMILVPVIRAQIQNTRNVSFPEQVTDVNAHLLHVHPDTIAYLSMMPATMHMITTNRIQDCANQMFVQVIMTAKIRKSVCPVFASLMILVPAIRVRTKNIRHVFQARIHQDMVATVHLLRAERGINAKIRIVITTRLIPDIVKS